MRDSPHDQVLAAADSAADAGTPPQPTPAARSARLKWRSLLQRTRHRADADAARQHAEEPRVTVQLLARNQRQQGPVGAAE